VKATLFAKPLPPGGTIGVSAPASPQDARSEVLRGVEWWESKGYRVKLSAGIYDRDDYVAGDARRRGEELTELFADPEVDVVQTLQGGYGSAEAIPHIDFGVVETNPKPFVGYSDITALHTAIVSKTGLATVYGNGLAGVGDPQTTDFSRQRLLQVLDGTAEAEVPRDPDDPYVRAIAGGTATAPLLGGCLWLLMQTMGTPWEIDLDGAIFFFEDVKAPPYYIDGFLTQLRHAGKLDNIAGVVVGEMKDCDWGDQREASDWARSRSLEDVLEEQLGSLGVPVLYKLPLGHGKHLASIPLGVRYALDAERRTLTLEEPPFRA
jgi:muramoyltetrapeptide carboxypeptidase